MKKILHITEAYGGVFNYIRDCVNWQADHQYEVHFVSGSEDKNMPANLADFLDPRVHITKIPEIKRSFNLIKLITAIRAIRKAVREIQPDIIHLHSSFAGFIGRIAINGKKTKLFYSPHAYGFAMQSCGRLKIFAYKTLEKIAGLCRCTTIADCPSEYEESKQVTKRATYVNNGIDIAEFDKIVASTGANIDRISLDSSPVVFMSGRICEQKNPEQFNRIAEKFPSLKFVWIGDGDLKDKLISPNIEITGWVTREQAITKALQCDIFLFTTQWESMSLALLECMYIKRLCVVMDAEGNRDVIKTHQSGFLCFSDNDMIQALTEVLEKKADIQKMTMQAHIDVVKEYNTEVKNANLIRVYEIDK